MQRFYRCNASAAANHHQQRPQRAQASTASTLVRRRKRHPDHDDRRVFFVRTPWLSNPIHRCRGPVARQFRRRHLPTFDRCAPVEHPIVYPQFQEYRRRGQLQTRSIGGRTALSRSIRNWISSGMRCIQERLDILCGCAISSGVARIRCAPGRVACDCPDRRKARRYACRLELGLNFRRGRRRRCDVLENRLVVSHSAPSNRKGE